MPSAIVKNSCRNAAACFDQQLHLASLVDGLPWQLHLDDGTLAFGDRYRWHVQLLGTESEVTHTWRWGWANQGDISPTVVQAALRLREIGQEHGIPEFLDPQFPLGDLNGHSLCVIAAGFTNRAAYFRAPYQGGAAFLLITCGSFPRCTDPPLPRIARVFPEALSSMPVVDHRLALAGYLEFYDLPFEEAGDRIVVRQGGADVLSARFDEHRRLVDLSVTVTGDEPEPHPPAPLG